MTPNFTTYLLIALVTGAVTFTAGMKVQSYRLGEKIKDIHLSYTKAEVEQSEAVREEELASSEKEAIHATKTQENSDAFTISQPVRDAISRTDLERLNRMRTDAERRAATYRAQAQADDAARRDLGNRLETFDRQLVEGVAVVGELRKDLIRRDAEIVLVIGQLMADRERIGQEKGPEQLP